MADIYLWNETLYLRVFGVFCVCVCVSINQRVVCVYNALPHIWPCPLCHFAGVCPVVSPETCTGSFPGPTATTLPELAQHQTLRWNVAALFFLFSFSSFALPHPPSPCAFLTSTPESCPSPPSQLSWCFQPCLPTRV